MHTIDMLHIWQIQGGSAGGREGTHKRKSHREIPPKILRGTGVAPISASRPAVRSIFSHPFSLNKSYWNVEQLKLQTLLYKLWCNIYGKSLNLSCWIMHIACSVFFIKNYFGTWAVHAAPPSYASTLKGSNMDVAASYRYSGSDMNYCYLQFLDGVSRGDDNNRA